MPLKHETLEEVLRANIGEMLIIELDRNHLGGDQALMRIFKAGERGNGRVNLLGGVMVGESHTELLLTLAGALALVNGDGEEE